MLALLHICGVVRSPPRVSRRALVLGAGAAALPTLPSFAAPLQMTAADGDVGSAILDAWERGDSTSSMRTLVESSAPSSRASASAVAATTAGWKGLWEARIEHFEKVRWTGLRVRPFYDLDENGGIVSHVHIVFGPLRGWASASGAMKPSLGGDASVTLVFDDFWVGADAPRPRAAPDETDPFDTFNRLLGRAAFFEGLASFPVDYADLKKDVVAFRFTAFDSMIVTRRAPAGATPERVQGA